VWLKEEDVSVFKDKIDRLLRVEDQDRVVRLRKRSAELREKIFERSINERIETFSLTIGTKSSKKNSKKKEKKKEKKKTDNEGRGVDVQPSIIVDVVHDSKSEVEAEVCESVEKETKEIKDTIGTIACNDDQEGDTIEKDEERELRMIEDELKGLTKSVFFSTADETREILRRFKEKISLHQTQ